MNKNFASTIVCIMTSLRIFFMILFVSALLKDLFTNNLEIMSGLERRVYLLERSNLFNSSFKYFLLAILVHKFGELTIRDYCKLEEIKNEDQDKLNI